MDFQLNVIESCMDVDTEKICIDDVFSTEQEDWLSAVTNVKLAVLCNDKQKEFYINMKIVPRLLAWMSDTMIQVELRIEAANLLGSLCKVSAPSLVTVQEEVGLMPVLLDAVRQENVKYTEACFRCVRTLVLSGIDMTIITDDPQLLRSLIDIMPLTLWTQECVTTILSHCCKTYALQVELCNGGILPALATLLTSRQTRVILPTLRCLAALISHNEHVALTVCSTLCHGEAMPDVLISFLAGDKQPEVRLISAKCLVYLYRCGTFSSDNNIIQLKTLPVLIRLCKNEFDVDLNIDAAKTLAYLIEVNSQLQEVASITDHCISTISHLLTLSKDHPKSMELQEAVFLAFASLASNKEEIRKKVVDIDSLVSLAIDNVESACPTVLIASLRCLLSLSRSVQHLRTNFHNIRPSILQSILQLMKHDNVNVVLASTALIANLLLEFSPTKSTLLDCGVIEILVSLTRNEENSEVRLNAVWALMNAAYQWRDMAKKMAIFDSLGMDQMFHLLSDANSGVVLKTVGLLRNLLYPKLHVEQMMDQVMQQQHGQQIINAAMMILDSNQSFDIKEQMLCVLVNIADGSPTSKDLIMANDSVMRKLRAYIMPKTKTSSSDALNYTTVGLSNVDYEESNEKMKHAVIMCFSNLSWNGDEGCHHRQTKLREMGVQSLLYQLLKSSQCSSGTSLHERVMKTLQQFTG